MKKLKLLYLDQAELLGGAELFSLDLLGKVDKKKFEIIVVSTDNPEHDQKIKKLGFKTKKINFEKVSLWHIPRFLRSVRQLQRLIKREKPALIHSNSVRGHLLSFVANWNNKIPLTWMMHDLTFSWPFTWITTWRPTQIIAASQYIAHSLEKKLFTRKKIEIICNGLDFGKLYKGRKPNLIAEFAFGADGFVVGIAGRLVQWKGQEIFIEAARLMRVQYPMLKFLIIGDGDDPAYAASLKKLIKKYQLEKQVILTGYRDDIQRIISGLDLLIHASTTPEPFGRTIIEAQALETPVIASDLGGPREIITNGIDGVLIRPGQPQLLADTIIRLLDSPHLRSSLVEAGRESARAKYRLLHWTRALEKLWQNLIK